MANINPQGVDLSTGQMRHVLSTDTITDNDGSPLVGAAPQVLYSSASGESGNVGSTETTMRTYSMPANTLTSSNTLLRIKAGGTWTTSKTVVMRVYFGASVVATTTSTSAGGWLVEAMVNYVGVTSQRSTASTVYLTSAKAEIITPSETLSSSIIIKVTGDNNTDAGNGVITSRYLTVELV
jgi:hypothetical protein